jgi:WD40 repeat protein
VYCIDFHPDGRTVALTTDVEDRVELWDVESGQRGFCLTSFVEGVERPNYSEVNSVLFGRDGSRLYVSDNTGHGVAAWDLPGRQLTRLTHDATARSLGLAGDGRWLVTFSGTHSVSVWDTASLARADFPRLGGYSATISAQVVCSRSPRGELVAFSSSVMQKVDVWNLDTRRRVDWVMLGINAAGSQCLAFRPDGRRLAVARGDRVVIATMATSEPARTLVSEPAAAINAMAVRADGARLAWTANGDPRVIVWDPGRGGPIRSLTGHEVGVLALAYGPSSAPDLLASAGADGWVRVWDSDRDDPARWALPGHVGEVEDVAFLPDGRTLISAGSDGTARVWDVVVGRLVRIFRGDAGPLQALAVAPDGRRAAAACGDGTVLVWDVRTGRRVLGPLDLDGIADDVAFSPDGSWLAAGGSTRGAGGTVAVWDAASGAEVSRWGTPGVVRSLVFSSDGRRAITGGSDGPLVIWDAATGRETIALEGHKKPVLALVAAPGLRVYSAGLDGAVRLWEGLDPGSAAPPGRRREPGDVIRYPSRTGRPARTGQ